MSKKTQIGHFQLQPTGYKAFIPLPFPPSMLLPLSMKLELKHLQAMRLIGKLDGITQLLPDKDFFLLMFLRKEAASSSQIEGTKATINDAVGAEIVPRSALPADVEDILYYIRALNYALKRFETLPLSIRFICELHEELMKDTRASQHPFPGELRRSQNWINGTSPSNARFVPPPPHEVPRSLGDLEKFIHAQNDGYPSLVKAALLHAQFETIHPFTDGNGRTGRLLISMFLWQEKLLETPILYLSDFFKKHQDTYYTRLQAYHQDPADIEGWIEFFLDGVIETATAEIEMAIKINQIRDQDMTLVHKLGKSAEYSVDLLRHLFRQPIVDVAKVQEWTGYTRAGAQKVIDRFIEIGILYQRDPQQTYGRTYEYKAYLKLFQ